ncbi:hypothetical protein L1049_019410 [Liquidambar formosana]|uniref:TPM domain-containing protein n=1 Tax=Liquidambar formosana TaxID=63359 RepID=A0AAP0S6J5_LIQFO
MAFSKPLLIHKGQGPNDRGKADAFEYADQVLERWYPSVEEGNDKGIVVLVTSQKEGAVTGGPAFVQAVGDTILDAIVSENLPGGNYVDLVASDP